MKTKSIAFTKSEIEILRKFYKHELGKAMEKVTEIKEILDKLGRQSKKITKPAHTIKKKTAVVAKIKKENKQGYKKTHSGKPAKSEIGWTALVTNTLKEKNTLLPAKAFLDIAVAKYRINQKDRTRTRSNITGCLSDLTKKYKRIMRYDMEGRSSGLYGLPEWFDTRGRLKVDYRKKIIL
ncbi:MAG: hypothetical protein HY958_10015 [Bacteroidia bacterium]|nr:hypothetical protein [Bacteroidia bacterium]